MGAWGAGSFENDDASDWVWELEEAENESILAEAFARVNDSEDDPEAPDCCIAIAAAEVVAAMRKRGPTDLPEEAAEFVKRMKAPSASLVASARRAVERIRTQSELKDLWDESESPDGWSRAIADLQSRLK